MSIILSSDELRAITGYKRPADQLRELHKLGFYRARRGRVTGEVILERAHVDAVAAGSVEAPAGMRSHPQIRQLHRLK